MVALKELEIGPHFITLYLDEFYEMEKVKRKVYNAFAEEFPFEAKFQQPYFNHTPNDDRIYHPYGSPSSLGHSYPRHFHIRSMVVPSVEFREKVVKLLEKCGCQVGEYKVSYLMTNGAKEGDHRVYPLVDTTTVKDYIKSLYNIKHSFNY